MTSQVLYRKWRPQTLAEVVGQGPITRTLLNALRQGRVGHAYLFCGPRGTGKTSTARILAKALNCEANGGRNEPCNACSACREITEGSFLDLIEVDAASNRGIDEIRDLREKVRFMPARGRTKVYIIDEAHMLTDPAFNALLKTLEEPPEHAVFILATTEPHRLPLTISSRCQRFDFRRIPTEDAVERLAEICAGEGFAVARDALDVVVRAASGSLRDAENLLEQLVLTAGPQASADEARGLLGVAGSRRARELLESLLVRQDLAAALTGLARLQEDGADMRQVQRELVEELRVLLLLKAGASDALDISPEERAERTETAIDLGLGTIRGALEDLAPLTPSPGGSPLPLEMAFVQIALRETPPAAASGPKQAEAAAPEPAPAVHARAPRGAEAVAAGRRAPRPVEPEAPRPADTPPATVDVAHGVAPTDRGVAGELTIDAVRARWREIVDGLRGVGSSGNLDAFLRSVSQPLSIDDGTLVVGFRHEFHRAKIDDPKYRHLVERRIAQILGKHYRLRCELVEGTRPGGHLVRAALERGARPAAEEGPPAGGDPVP